MVISTLFTRIKGFFKLILPSNDSFNYHHLIVSRILHNI
jgi:hypothetical protein